MQVIIEDAEPDVFQKFLLFLYTGNEDYIIWQNITDLYKLADKYGVEDVKNVCRNDIQDNISGDNACNFFKFSLLHNDKEITKTTVLFFSEHPMGIILGKKWVTFPPEDLKKWLSEDHIKENITTENFFVFAKLSQIQNESELTEAIVKFFLKKSKDIVGTVKWMLFRYNNFDECNVLIKALSDKNRSELLQY